MEVSRRCCGRCKIEKPLEDFHKNSSSKWGVVSICKNCKSMKKVVELSEDTKECSTCKKELSISLFKKASNKSGLSSKCKYCTDEVDSAYRAQLSLQPPSEITEKLCTGCLEVKDIINFRIDKYNKVGYKSRCIECCKIYHRNYHSSNYIISRSPKRTDEERRAHVSNRMKKRLAEDILFKLKRATGNVIRCSFNRVLKNESKKKSRTTDILDCTIEEFKSHIESQFLNWMTWDNYGNCDTTDYNCSWSLDHIIPLAYAKTEYEVFLLNHWSNFQPLCSKINRNEKRDKIPYLSNIILKFTTQIDNIPPF